MARHGDATQYLFYLCHRQSATAEDRDARPDRLVVCLTIDTYRTIALGTISRNSNIYIY